MPRSLAKVRLILLLLCSSLVAFRLMAAPVPVYRAKAFEDWLSGWDKPVDPVGGCRFDRERSRLTIRLPKGHSREAGLWKGRKDVPHILREIEGDFDVQVRITGEFELPEDICGHGNPRKVGLMLDAGKTGCFSERSTWMNGQWTHLFSPSYLKPSGETTCGCELEPRGARTYHRLSRRGDRVRMAVSLDGKKWCQLRELEEMSVLPRVVKVGVFAWKSGPIPFKAVFDEFKFTRPRSRSD